MIFEIWSTGSPMPRLSVRSDRTPGEIKVNGGGLSDGEDSSSVAGLTEVVDQRGRGPRGPRPSPPKNT